MGLTASDKGGGGFKQIPGGTYAGRCVKLVDIGTQQQEYQGVTKWTPQVIITWETPFEKVEIEGEEKPYIISKFYTVSLHEKATLRKELEAWRGRSFTEEELKGFDLTNILDKPCMLNVIEKEGKSKLVGIMPLPKGMDIPNAINPLVVFDLEKFIMGDPDMDEIFRSFSDNMKALIKKSEEWQTQGEHVENNPQYEDDIPF